MQQWGRAGRSGAPARCYLFYSRRDFHFTTDDSKQVLQFAENNCCRWRSLLRFFGQGAEDLPPDGCGNCDICLDPPRVEDFGKQVRLVLDVLKQASAVSEQQAKPFTRLRELVKSQGTILHEEWALHSAVLGGNAQWMLRAFLDHLCSSLFGEKKLLECKIISLEGRQNYWCAAPSLDARQGAARTLPVPPACPSVAPPLLLVL